MQIALKPSGQGAVRHWFPASRSHLLEDAVMRVRGTVGWTATLAVLGAFVVPCGALAAGAGARSHPPEGAAQQSPKAIFHSVCSTCHGPEGKGNGPAGAAFNPKPANFTDPAFWKTHTDSQLVNSITHGKGMMPAFGGTYDHATVEALVKYLHVLSGLKSGGATPGA
jgi:mono/diheme cytochrome c family protein